MQTRISELTTVSSVAGNEQIPVVKSGSTMKATPSQIMTYIYDSLDLETTITQDTNLYNYYTSGLILSTSRIVSGSGTLASSQSITSGTETTLDSITLSNALAIGIIVVNVYFGANSSGYRDVTVTKGSTEVEHISVAAAPSGVTRVQVVYPCKSVSSDSVSVAVKHNVGSAINVTASYEYIGFKTAS